MAERIEGELAIWARARAFACGFFKDDFSMCPDFVGAGKTQSDVASVLLVSIKPAALSLNGIDRRAFSVFPKGMFKAPSRTYSQRRRKHSSGLSAQSITVATSRNRNGSLGSFGCFPRKRARMPPRARKYAS